MIDSNVNEGVRVVKRCARDVALRLLKTYPGFHFVWINAGTKDQGLPGNYYNDPAKGPPGSTNDPKVIAKWPADCNVGLVPKVSGAVVVDTDTKPGKVGAQTFVNLEAKHGPFPETLTVRTPSGGFHRYYVEANGVKYRFALGVHGFGKDVDSPAYVLIPGSVIDGRAYTVVKPMRLAPTPEWFKLYLDPPQSNREPREPSGPAVSLVLFKRMLAVTPYVGGPPGLDNRHDYEPWLDFLFALYDAAGGDSGDYLEAVIEWSLNDPSHDWTKPTSRELIEDKWKTISDPDARAGQPAITRASWFKVLQHFGHDDLVGLVQVAEDFTDPEEELTDQQKRAEQRAEAVNAARGNAPLTHKDYLFYLPEKGGFICKDQGADILWTGKSVDLMCPWIDTGQPKINPKKEKCKTAEERIAIDTFDDIYVHGSDGKIVNVFESPSRLIAGNPKQRVVGMTWWPGKPDVIRDTIFHIKGGIKPKRGAHTFNRYVAPFIIVTAIDKVPPKPWLDHVKLVYPNDWQHIVHWLAQRVQFPDVKINHALVLGGGTRIGKDLILHPVTHAIGEWNFESTTALTIMTEPKFNPYLEAVICLVHEVEDFGDENRFNFYARMKPWLGGTAVSVLKVADKNVKVHPVVDLVGFVIGTNHKVRGLFLPPDDARHYVAWSYRTWEDWGYATQDELVEKYHGPLFDYFNEQGGNEQVTHYLRTLDLSKFNPKAPPPRTAAWHEIVNARLDPDTKKLQCILDGMDNPPGVTVAAVSRADTKHTLEWMGGNRSKVSEDFEDCGYVMQLNDGTRWTYGPKGKRIEPTIYVRAKLTAAEKLAAAREAFEREKAHASET